MQIQLYSNKSKTNNHTYLYMFRNQVDITVQFSKMMISYLKIYFFLQFSNLKPWLVKSIMVLFSAFLMNSNFFLSAHTVSWMCVYYPKGAAGSVFDTFCPGESKIVVTFSDTSRQDRMCFRTARSDL